MEGAVDIAEARQKIAAVSSFVGREVRVFLNPARIPAPPPAPPAEEATSGAAKSDEAEEDSRQNGAGQAESSLAGPTDVPEGFYDFTAADYARIMGAKKEDRFLKTKKVRDEEEAALRSRISQAVVRVEFPDGLILEATYSPADSITAVRETLARCLDDPKTPFYFYTTPPKQRIKDEAVSLYSAGLAPGALIHIAREEPQPPKKKGGKASDSASATAARIVTSTPCVLRADVKELQDLHVRIQQESEKDGEEHEGERQRRAKEAAEAEKSVASLQPSSSSAGGKPSGGKPKWFKR